MRKAERQADKETIKRGLGIQLLDGVAFFEKNKRYPNDIVREKEELPLRRRDYRRHQTELRLGLAVTFEPNNCLQESSLMTVAFLSCYPLDFRLSDKVFIVQYLEVCKTLSYSRKQCTNGEHHIQHDSSQLQYDTTKKIISAPVFH